MLPTLGVLFGVLLVLLVAILLLAATKPGTLRVQRETKIKAPPERVFGLLDDFHKWPSWSPWEKMDPAMTRTHSGAASGRGAVYAWKGNNKVGEGRMEITETDPPSRILLKLDFIRPFEAHNVTEFTLEAQEGSTRLLWAMQGPQPFLGKVMSVFLNMDRLIGKDFEAGLANLKALSES